jgi:acyl-CoA thioesterase
MTKLEEAQAYFANDRFATENGAVITELAEDHATCALTITPRHRNALGNVMGGALFMLGDFAFAVASNFGKSPTVSATSQITFLRAAQGEQIFARADLVRQGRSTVYYEISITDAAGTLCARMTASGSILR